MRKQPKRITAEYLDRAALHYLERFASSSENLRRVLMRKVQRAAQAHGDDPADGQALVEALVERYRASGLLDDRLYADAKTRTLHRRGASLQKIRSTLAAKGIDSDTAVQALTELRDEHGDETDLAAALNFARRKRLGRFRPEALRADFRDKDLAALGRAGFSFDVARRVLVDDED